MCPVRLCKIFLFRPTPNHFYTRRRLVPHKGRIAVVTDAGRDAVDAMAFCARRGRRAGDEPVSGQQRADERRFAYGKIVWVRPDGASYQWRQVPYGQLSIGPVADERFCRATGWTEAS
jgi:hypothetical protein